ncbi:MAG: Arc family DNA-binding protein [Candidatus Bipolaricaulia bacterium]
MAVNLSIKNVSEELAEQLRQRAKRHHRSLQGELLAILEEAVKGAKRLTLEEAYRQVRVLGLKTESEAAQMIREDRDAH